jgi:hypothetical protein
MLVTFAKVLVEAIRPTAVLLAEFWDDVFNEQHKLRLEVSKQCQFCAIKAMCLSVLHDI